MPAPANDALRYEVLRKHMRRLLDRFRVTDARKFRLKHYDPADTAGHAFEKPLAQAMLVGGVERLAEQQEKLYAQDRWAMLCCFQAMDAAGKDGTIKNVMSGVNPQGVEVTSFKPPSPEELEHDFLWRIARALPRRGRVGIFNRSHYEEVLVVRVHPALLEKQHLPTKHFGKRFWAERLEAIAAFERHLAQQGYVIQKFFLHVSREEQKRRFLERLQEPEKNWKFSASDIAERDFWDDYMAAYEAAITATAAPHAPWYVVPADNKWFTRLVVVAAMNEALDALDLRFPRVDAAARAALNAARVKLEAEP